MIPLANCIPDDGPAGVVIQCLCTYRVVKSLPLQCIFQCLPPFLNELALYYHHLEQQQNPIDAP